MSVVSTPSRADVQGLADPQADRAPCAAIGAKPEPRSASLPPVDVRELIRQIVASEPQHAALDRASAARLMAAMLDQRVSELELGGLLLALRMKQTTATELAGFVDAAQASLPMLLRRPPGRYAPVVIPSYLGARQIPNLTPLLALELADAGVPVLVHGVLDEPGRVTSAEIFSVLGISAARNPAEAQLQLDAGQPVFLPIDALHPGLARLLDMRQRLGVCNAAHTMVRLLQPFAEPALRLVGYNRPTTLKLLCDYFALDGADALQFKSTEGEVVADARRPTRIDLWQQGQCTTLAAPQPASAVDLPALPASCRATETAWWVQAVLSGERPLPKAIARQLECVLVALQRMSSPLTAG